MQATLTSLACVLVGAEVRAVMIGVRIELVNFFEARGTASTPLRDGPRAAAIEGFFALSIGNKRGVRRMH